MPASTICMATISPTALFMGLGWLVTGLGWYVSHLSANARETRKEVRNSIDSLQGSVNELLTISCDYYTCTDPNTQHRHVALILTLVERIRRQIDSFERYKIQNLQAKLAPLFEEITGGDFGKESRKPAAGDKEKIKTIALRAEQLNGCLDTWVQKRYHQDG
jgi:hypothetical protein